MLLCEFERGFSIRCEQHVKTFRAEKLGEEKPERLFVINDEQSSRHESNSDEQREIRKIEVVSSYTGASIGKRIVNITARGDSLSKVIAPL